MGGSGIRNNTLDNKRIIGLDVLRSIAIFLTLCRHSLAETNFLWQIGWIGVHLFFIISSYLIANILFTEYYQQGKIDFSRFLIRRSLKIYPLYYLFILISVYKNSDLFLSSLQYKQDLFGQIFHLQNYTPILWYHTWSLAAEEHFYIGFCLILFSYLLLSRTTSLNSLAWILGLVIISAPLFRYNATSLYHTEWFMGTHYIMDGFAIGTILALSKFALPDLFSAMIKWRHYLLIPVIALLSPACLFKPGNIFLNSIGISMMYVGFTFLVVYILSIEEILKKKNFISSYLISPLTSIGIASYSIYLFHAPVKSIIDSISMNESIRIPVYFLACIVAGKIAWYLIEMPIALYKSRSLSTAR